MEAGVAVFGEHSKEVLSIETGLFRKLSKSAMNLGHVADGQQEIAIIAFFEAGV